jgi:cytochrome c-type biogenesis protein CcmH/NrfG
MPNEAVEQKSTVPVWRASQVYSMAIVCLVVGLAIGYLFRGSQSAAPPAAPQSAAAGRGAAAMHQMPSLEQMKHMADSKAQPLLEKLKTDPNNADTLSQLGNIYKSTHQFKEAIEYYQKASDSDPKNVAIRTELASCMYYNGDVEGAITQLQQSLKQNPKDANSLFNLGMIRWHSMHFAASTFFSSGTGWTAAKARVAETAESRRMNFRIAMNLWPIIGNGRHPCAWGRVVTRPLVVRIAREAPYFNREHP